MLKSAALLNISHQFINTCDMLNGWPRLSVAEAAVTQAECRALVVLLNAPQGADVPTCCNGSFHPSTALPCWLALYCMHHDPLPMPG